MRIDEYGNRCPETLGEYRDLCEALGGPGCPAVKFLDGKIAEQGANQVVIVADALMRGLLMPMLITSTEAAP